MTGLFVSGRQFYDSTCLTAARRSSTGLSSSDVGPSANTVNRQPSGSSRIDSIPPRNCAYVITSAAAATPLSPTPPSAVAAATEHVLAYSYSRDYPEGLQL